MVSLGSVVLISAAADQLGYLGRSSSKVRKLVSVGQWDKIIGLFSRQSYYNIAVSLALVLCPSFAKQLNCTSPPS